MADSAGVSDERNGLSDQIGAGTSRATSPAFPSFTLPRPFSASRLLNDVQALDEGSQQGGPRSPGVITHFKAQKGGASSDLNSIGESFYERIIVIPRVISVGNILATIVIEIDLYNSDRKNSVDFESFTNNAGAGIVITDLPGLPVTLGAEQSQLLTLNITTDGPPSIDGSLDFGFDSGLSVSIPVTGNRIVMFPFRPETPLQERLRFLTEIFEHKDGGEQRVSLRSFPRQEFLLNLLQEEGSEATRVELLLFDWQARVFGLPVWTEPMIATQAIAVDDTIVQVASTDFTDLRAGGIAMAYTDDQTFEALEVTSFDATSITFASPFGRAFPAGTEILPVRAAVTESIARGSRRARGLRSFRLRFRVTDNNTGDIADASAFSSFLGDVFLDDPNALDGAALGETFERQLTVFDNLTGKISVESRWDVHKRAHRKGFVTRTRQRLWEIRQLLHFLRGRQVSFWMSTFHREIEPTQLLLSGTATLTIDNVGYARFVQDRASRDRLRIRLTDGTELFRQVVNSSEIDEAEEQLTLDANWPNNIQVDEVERIDFLEKVRIDADDIAIEHRDANGSARIFFPVKGVFGE